MITQNKENKKYIHTYEGFIGVALLLDVKKSGKHSITYLQPNVPKLAHVIYL